MNYKKTFIKISKRNKSQTRLINDSFFNFAYRRLSFFITPFFLILRLSPNFVSLLYFIISILSCLLIFLTSQDFYRLAIFLFLIGRVIDCVDGNIARIKNKTSFFGRFMDGFFGITIGSFLQFAICILIYNIYGNSYLFWLGLFSALFEPYRHFILDRYSALARWNNEENKKKILPYVRKNNYSRVLFSLLDLQEISLILSAIFIFSYFVEYLFLFFFVINILLIFYTVFYHLVSSYINMQTNANDHR